jgi:hypothetical protein
MAFVIVALALGALCGMALVVSSLRDGRRAEVRVVPIPAESKWRPPLARRDR